MVSNFSIYGYLASIVAEWIMAVGMCVRGRRLISRRPVSREWHHYPTPQRWNYKTAKRRSKETKPGVHEIIPVAAKPWKKWTCPVHWRSLQEGEDSLMGCVWDIKERERQGKSLPFGVVYKALLISRDQRTGWDWTEIFSPQFQSAAW